MFCYSIFNFHIIIYYIVYLKYKALSFFAGNMNNIYQTNNKLWIDMLNNDINYENFAENLRYIFDEKKWWIIV